MHCRGLPILSLNEQPSELEPAGDVVGVRVQVLAFAIDGGKGADEQVEVGFRLVGLFHEP
jgi:hypothetical protein